MKITTKMENNIKMKMMMNIKPMKETLIENDISFESVERHPHMKTVLDYFVNDQHEKWNPSKKHWWQLENGTDVTKMM